MKHVLQQTIDDHFGGLLRRGSHNWTHSTHLYKSVEACAIEAAHVAMGHDWSDKPTYWPDIRAINDSAWKSDQSRTKSLVALLKTYWTWQAWPIEQKHATAKKVIIASVRYLVPHTPRLFVEEVRRCKQVRTLFEAESALIQIDERGQSGDVRTIIKILLTACIMMQPPAGEIAVANVLERCSRAVDKLASLVIYQVRDSEHSDAILRQACRIWVRAAKE